MCIRDRRIREDKPKYRRFFFGESQVYLLNVKTIFILQWASRQPYTMIDTPISDTRTTIYRDTVWDVTPEWRQNTRQNNWTRPRRLVAVNYLFLAPCLYPLFRLSPVWPFLSFCCPSAEYIILLWTDRTTSKQQPCPLTNRPPTWAHVCFRFIYNFFILLPGTP